MIGPAAEDQLATEFAQLRPYLLRVAYSHLGSLSEAEDLVQEAWIRLERSDRAEIRNLRAWLTTVVSRLALDALDFGALAPRALRRPVAARASS